VPDWSEITCRFPPKSPAAFDRNQVPVCSDFCMPVAGAPGMTSYRPRTEGLFARIEHFADAGTNHWEVRSKDGLLSVYGTPDSFLNDHATLCIAAYGFLIAERGALPPSGPPFAAPLPRSAIPGGYRPRGAADPARAPHPKLDRDHATTPHRRSRQDPPEMPLLQRLDPQDIQNSRLLTQ
jgi:Salmonella virulence plasmid 65kDa B protein